MNNIAKKSKKALGALITLSDTPKYLFMSVFALFSAFGLHHIIPSSWIDIGLGPISSNSGTLIFSLNNFPKTIFVILSGWLLSFPAWVLLKLMIEKWHLFRMHRHFKFLSAEEVEFLKNFLINDGRSGIYDMRDPIVSSLENRLFLNKTNAVAIEYLDFSYQIQPWVWEYLTKKPQKINLIYSNGKFLEPN